MMSQCGDEASVLSMSKGVFSPPTILKNFRFWFIILQNKTKYHAKFLVKSGYSSFCILASKGKKKLKRAS
jgi:hypothetical protein